MRTSDFCRGNMFRLAEAPIVYLVCSELNHARQQDGYKNHLSQRYYARVVHQNFDYPRASKTCKAKLKQAMCSGEQIEDCG